MSNRKTASKPKILITGKNGQVGWELQRSMSHIGDVFAFDVEDMDLTNNDSIVSVIRNLKPNIIINPAAYTAVDKAEENAGLAMQINGIAPGVMAEEAAKLNSLMIHYSTDYVFDGTKEGVYTEDDGINPINVYGSTKLAGEQTVQASGVNYYIFRTSWVYASRAQNFMHSMLRLAKEREELKIVDDQIGAPTWARLISDVSLHALLVAQNEIQNDSFESGVFNLVASGQTSWCGFANKIIEIAKGLLNMNDLVVQNINPIPTSEYPTPAKRPLNSQLDLSKLEKHFNIYIPNWERSLRLCMQELK